MKNISLQILLIFAATMLYCHASIEELSNKLNSPGKITEKINLPKKIVIESIKSQQYAKGANTLSDYTVKIFKLPSHVLLSQKVKILAVFADGAVCIQQLSPRNTNRPIKIRDDVLEWLFNSNIRLRLLADTFSQDDNMQGVIKIIETLYDADPAGRDIFFNLIIAMAVVWDQKRPLTHYQMGPNTLAYKPQIKDRYNFFRKLYSTNSGKLLYKELDIQSLCLVVDTPVPISELEWARDNVKGSRSNWNKKYSQIVYDHQRLDRGIYIWPYGEYSLAKIEEIGGICVDQAYYAAITARAHGIPALYFSGPGRRGGHAWFSYKKGKNNWALDCGRYLYDKYATGNSINPQTNRKMTDHDVDYTCDHSLRSRLYQTANCYTRIANILFNHKEYSLARSCTKEARTRAKRYEEPWDIEIETWLREGNKNKAIITLEAKAKAFSKYPDISTAARKREAKLLIEMGRTAESEKVLRRQAKRVMQDRDDLGRDIVANNIKNAIETGDVRQSRKDMEDLRTDQKEEGSKIFPLIQVYLNLTKRTGQTHEAAKFMRRYTRELIRTYGETANNKQIIYAILLQTYENDNDERGANKVKKEIARIR